jgi:hypothetical protein
MRHSKLFQQEVASKKEEMLRTKEAEKKVRQLEATLLSEKVDRERLLERLQRREADLER